MLLVVEGCVVYFVVLLVVDDCVVYFVVLSVVGVSVPLQSIIPSKHLL